MPAKIPNDKRKDAIRHWLLGETRDEIASKVGIGEGTVSDALKEWKSKLADTDYESIRILAIEMKKNRLAFKDMANVVRVYNTVKKDGEIEIDEIEGFLANIKDICIREQLGYQEIMQVIKQMLSICATENLKPQQVTAILEQKLKELQKIKEEIEAGAKEKERIDQERLAALKEKKVTVDTIKEHIRVRDALKKHGFLLENAGSLAIILENCQKLGNDSEKIAATFSSIKNLEDRIQRYKGEISKLEESRSSIIVEIERSKGHLRGLARAIAGATALISATVKLKKLGIGDDMVIACAEMLSSYSPASVDLRRLLEDLQQYKTVAAINESLTSTNAELKSQETKLSEDIKDLQIRKERLDHEVDELVKMTQAQIEAIRKEAIGAIQSIRKERGA